LSTSGAENSFATAPLCALLNTPETNFGARNMKFSCLPARVCWVENWLFFGLTAHGRPPDIIELSLCSPVNCCYVSRDSSGVIVDSRWAIAKKYQPDGDNPASWRRCLQRMAPSSKIPQNAELTTELCLP